MERAKAVFTRAFFAYGLPLGMRCDNGAPFGSRNAGGLTRLSVWWLKLGIEPHFIRPASPQENGRHERMHRTLKKQTSQLPAADAREQQARFDALRRHYDTKRPHQGRGMNGRTPLVAFREGLPKPEPKKEEKIKTEKPPKQLAA